MTKTRESGAVLLVVLVALALLAALAGVALRLGQAGLQGLAGERAEFQREVLMQSALASIGAQLGGRSDILRDGTPFVLDLPGGQVQARVQAAEGLVNPAHVRLPILRALLTALDASPDQAQRLTRAVSDARVNSTLADMSDLAPIFAGDLDLWRKLRPYLTFLGDRTTIDPSSAPELLRFVLPMAAEAAVDVTQGVGRKGMYEIDLRILAPVGTKTADPGGFTHYSVLRDRGGRMHLFATSWPEEDAG